MNKGLVALHLIRVYLDTEGELEMSNEINIIEAELKRLEEQDEILRIIKKKKVDVDLFYTIIEDENQTDKLWSYNYFQAEKNKLTQSEFDLLREVLL